MKATPQTNNIFKTSQPLGYTSAVVPSSETSFCHRSPIFNLAANCSLRYSFSISMTYPGVVMPKQRQRAGRGMEGTLPNCVFGRTKVKGFFEETRIHAPKEEWVIVENTYEPIISRELWDTVQQLMKTYYLTNNRRSPDRFR